MVIDSEFTKFQKILFEYIMHYSSAKIGQTCLKDQPVYIL